MYFELIRIIANIFLLVNRWEEKRNANACPFKKTAHPLFQTDCERNVNMEANGKKKILVVEDEKSAKDAIAFSILRILHT